jgi:hypothetical protein
MSEQQETVNQGSVKNERSSANQSARLSYDCLIASAKTFLHHFSSLSDEEKTEYKSLANHVKQLNRCNESIKKLSTPVKRAIAPKVVVEQAPVVTEVATEATSKPKRGGSNKRSSKEEQSPTAQVAAATVTEQKKGGRAKKTQEAVAEPAPVVEKKVAAPKKGGATKTK